MDEENDSDVKEILNKNPPDMSEDGSVGTVISKDMENDLDVKEIQNCLDKNPPDMSEDGSVGTVINKDVEDVISVVSKECTSETNQVLLKDNPQRVRRNSTGGIGTVGGKPQVQSRYRGNIQVSSTHDFCKHGGKRCDQEVAVKPWKVVKKPQSSVAAKRDVVDVRKKLCSSVNSDVSSSRAGSIMARSVDGLSVKSYDKARKTKETGSAVVKKAPALRNDKSKSAMEKVSRISEAESSKASVAKSLKNKEKGKVTTGEDVKEKTVCVVESSIKGVQIEKRPSSGKKTMRSGDNRLTTPTTKQVPGSINISLNKEKESGTVEAEASPKTAKKVRSKRIGAKVDIVKPLSFKKGKTIEPKSEGSSPRWMTFRRRPVQGPKPQTEETKMKLKNVETKSESCEGGSSKGVKVVLRHHKVEGKKKMVTLFNNVIEETVNKLTKVRKDKVKALIGAFETVISLQDSTKTSQKVPRKGKSTTTSSSQVSPLNSQQ